MHSLGTQKLMKNFIFLPSYQGGHRSKRELELETANVKAHAAIVAHQHRRRQSQSTASEQLEARKNRLSPSDVDSTIRSATCHPSLLQILPLNGTRVDPFTELPIKAEGIVPATLDYCTPSLSFLAASTDPLQFSASAFQSPVPATQSKAMTIRICRCCFHSCCKMLSSSNQS
jgi:hypothetical protein